MWIGVSTNNDHWKSYSSFRRSNTDFERGQLQNHSEGERAVLNRENFWKERGEREREREREREKTNSFEGSLKSLKSIHKIENAFTFGGATKALKLTRLSKYSQKRFCCKKYERNRKKLIWKGEREKKVLNWNHIRNEDTIFVNLVKFAFRLIGWRQKSVRKFF